MTTSKLLGLLTQLRELGVQLSIDDFGTGYSSLSYLQRFPIDTLKIDRSFVTQMMENEENLAIVRTIVALAQNLGMDVVAEGVETEDQLKLLRKLECENGQGYLFSTPLGGRQLDQFIATCNLQPSLDLIEVAACVWRRSTYPDRKPSLRDQINDNQNNRD